MKISVHDARRLLVLIDQKDSEIGLDEDDRELRKRVYEEFPELKDDPTVTANHERRTIVKLVAKIRITVGGKDVRKLDQVKADNGIYHGDCLPPGTSIIRDMRKVGNQDKEDRNELKNRYSKALAAVTLWREALSVHYGDPSNSVVYKELKDATKDIITASMVKAVTRGLDSEGEYSIEDELMSVAKLLVMYGYYLGVHGMGCEPPGNKDELITGLIGRHAESMPELPACDCIACVEMRESLAVLGFSKERIIEIYAAHKG